MKIPHEIAEERKIRYGNVIPTDQQEAEDKTFAYSGYHICYRDLCDIVRLRVEELLRLIVMELPDDIGVKLVPAGLVLTGGSANLPGIAELATQIAKVPSRVGIPRRIYSVSDSLNGPAFATGIGLILWKATNQDAKGSYELTSFRNFLPRLARVFR
jgi:cell division protein FtsA